jgi:hypothetical protein
MNRRDFALAVVGLDPRMEFRPQRDLVPPDQDTVLYGPEAYLAFGRNWFASFDSLELTPEEFLDLGDKLLVRIRWTGDGSGSGVAFSQPMFQLFHLDRGLVVKQEDFGNRTEALEAVGLSE